MAAEATSCWGSDFQDRLLEGYTTGGWPAVCQDRDGAMAVFACSAETGLLLVTRRVPGSGDKAARWWPLLPLDEFIVGNPVAVRAADGRIAVFFRGRVVTCG